MKLPITPLKYHCTSMYNPKTSLSTINLLEICSCKFFKFSDHETALFSLMRNCLLWLHYEALKLCSTQGSGNQEARYMCQSSSMRTSNPTSSKFIMCWIRAEHGGWCNWLVVKNNFKHKRWTLLTIFAMFLVWNFGCHMTKEPSTFYGRPM